MKLIMENWRVFANELKSGLTDGDNNIAMPEFILETKVPITRVDTQGNEEEIDMPYYIIEAALRDGKTAEEIERMVINHEVTKGFAFLDDRLSDDSMRFLNEVAYTWPGWREPPTQDIQDPPAPKEGEDAKRFENPKVGDRVSVGDSEELGGSWTEEAVILAIIDQHTVKVGFLGADLCARAHEVPRDLIFQPKN